MLDAAAGQDPTRLRTEYVALERHLEQRGLGVPEHVQRRYAELRRAVGPDQAGGVTSANGARPRPVAGAGVQEAPAAAETN